MFRGVDMWRKKVSVSVLMWLPSYHKVFQNWFYFYKIEVESPKTCFSSCHGTSLLLKGDPLMMHTFRHSNRNPGGGMTFRKRNDPTLEIMCVEVVLFYS